jgi:hypothetical protein
MISSKVDKTTCEDIIMYSNKYHDKDVAFEEWCAALLTTHPRRSGLRPTEKNFQSSSRNCSIALSIKQKHSDWAVSGPTLKKIPG